MNTRDFFSLLTLGGSLLFAAHASAIDPAAQARIQQLEQQVLGLEDRLQALEERFDRGVPTNKALVVEARPGGWRNADNWAQLARGMDKYEVERFLGEAERTRSVSKFEYWLYGDGKATLYMNRLKNWEVPSQAGD